MAYPDRLSETMAFGNGQGSKPARGRVEGSAKIRCKYVPVRSAPPSMAPHDFGRAFHPPAPTGVVRRKMQFRLTCINGISQSWF